MYRGISWIQSLIAHTSHLLFTWTYPHLSIGHHGVCETAFDGQNARPVWDMLPILGAPFSSHVQKPPKTNTRSN